MIEYMPDTEQNEQASLLRAAKGHLDHLSRRNVLKTIGVTGGAFALGRSSVTGRAAAASAPWTIVAIPDTQKYAESSSLMSYPHDQVDWIVGNRSAENIAFVTHVGDVVEHGSSETEWQRMDAVLDKLDGVVPYAVGIGNHDYAVTGDRSSSTANYREYFGKSRYQSRSWFGGAAPNDLGHYQFFSAGGYRFLHLDLEWGVPGTTSDPMTVMGWAQDVLDANESVPTIITTHSYIWDKVGYEGHATALQGANSGRQIFRNLVRSNPQVFMVINGHWHRADGEWAQVSTNSAGSKIYEMLADYQHYANGGNGWLRTIEFVPGGGGNSLDRIQVQTYSPSLDQYQTDGRSRFAFDLSFAERFGSSSGGSTEEPPTTGTTTSITIGSADGDPVKYEFTVSSTDVVKSNACGASINKNDSVLSAGDGATGAVKGTGRDSYEFSGEVLSFSANGSETTYLDCEQVDLDSSSGGGTEEPPTEEPPTSGTTTSLTIGSADGSRVEYSFAVSSSDVAKSNVCGASINSSDTISNAGDGATGYVTGGGHDSYEFSGSVVSFSADDSAVTYLDCKQVDLSGSSEDDTGEPTTVTETTISFREGVGGYAGTVDTYLRESAPTADNGTAPVLTADGSDPHRSGHATQPLLRFDDIVGSGSGQIPPGSFVTSATLEVITVDEGRGSTLHRMNVDWDESDTWGSLGSGVQTDGAEAETYADAETSHPVEVGTTSIDVTSSVQAWANGTANHGWVFVPSGNDGWDFYSSEGTTAPALRVTYRNE